MTQNIVFDTSYNSDSQMLVCKCGNPKCSVNQMSPDEISQIENDYSFAGFFPSLFLKRVPLEYTVDDVNDIFNAIGDNIVNIIAVIPGTEYNHFIIKFHEFNISQESYEKTLCLHWAIYKNPRASAKMDHFENVEIYKFDQEIWDASPHDETSVYEFYYPYYSEERKREMEKEDEENSYYEDECEAHTSAVEEDESQYEYCEIMEGVWHKRPRDLDEDPDELHRRISTAKSPEERARAFWG